MLNGELFDVLVVVESGEIRETMVKKVRFVW
jgi:hypothetical protein